MPRELFPPQEPVLTHSPEPDDGALDHDLSMRISGENPPEYDYPAIGDDDLDGRELELSNAFTRNDDLHPFVQSLSISDLDACVALESAAFPEHERCSKEKFCYRLTTCPELSLGVFSSTANPPAAESKASFAAAQAPDATKPAHKALLVGQVIATLSGSNLVTDASMQVPADFAQIPNSDTNQSATGPNLNTVVGRNNGNQTSTDADGPSPAVPTKDPPPSSPKDSTQGLPKADQSNDTPGHHTLGRTITIHSVCVLPQFQGCGLGKMVLRSYIQRMETSGIADRAALLAHPELIPWYMGLGFQNRGASKVQFGGGGWHDLVYEFDATGFC